MSTAKAIAAAAAQKSETVDEYVLYRIDGENRHPLFSDHELDVVRSVGRDAVMKARTQGLERPQLKVTRRRCVYPLSADGNRQAMGSTCDETEV